MIPQCSSCIHMHACLEQLIARGYDTDMWFQIQNAARTEGCTEYFPSFVASGKAK